MVKMKVGQDLDRHECGDEASRTMERGVDITGGCLGEAMQKMVNLKAPSGKPLTEKPSLGILQVNKCPRSTLCQENGGGKVSWVDPHAARTLTVKRFQPPNRLV